MIFRIKTVSILYLLFRYLLISTLLFTAACQSENRSGGQLHIQGNLNYLQRIALPQDAVAIVRLLDISLVDAPSKVLAEQRIELNGKQVPVPFALAVERAQLDARMRYSVSARIEDGAGNLLWITDSNHPVDPNRESADLGSLRLAQVHNTPQNTEEYFHASGNEPFWMLELGKNESMEFTYNAGEAKAATPLPEKIQSGNKTIYRAETEAHKLEVIIEQHICVDSMSGREFSHTVEVVRDGEHYSGCGEMRALSVE
jgi:putative lipoprotein